MLLSPTPVAARWTSQLPPRPWTVAGPGPRGVPDVGRSRLTIPTLAGGDRSGRETGSTAPFGTVSRDNRPSSSWSPLQSGSRPAGPSPIAMPEGTGPWVLLSWPCPLHPSAVRCRCVHSRRAGHRNGQLAFGSGIPSPDVSFRPRGLSPPRRLSPHPGPRVCCTPLPALRFVAFPPVHPTIAPGRGPMHRGDGIRLSRDAVTLRRVSSPGSRTASLRSLPSCRFPPHPVKDGPGRLQGVAPPASPWRSDVVSDGRSLAPPMGFCPLRGPLGSRSASLAPPVRERTGEEWRNAHRARRWRSARRSGWRFTRRRA